MTTKQTGHTPGEWEVHAELNVVSKSGRFIASCGMNSTIKNEVPQSKANARLIAAAPELLEALKAIRYCMTKDGVFVIGMQEQELLDQAIAKAEGR